MTETQPTAVSDLRQGAAFEIGSARRAMIERLSIMYALAMPGPWKVYQNGVHPCEPGGMGSGDDYAVLTHGPRGYVNGNWIAAIHNEWPMLLDLIREIAGDQSIGQMAAELDAYIAGLRSTGSLSPSAEGATAP